MFKSYVGHLGFVPKDGMKVNVLGQVAVFERDGIYQIYAKAMQQDGMGSLYEEYEKLMNRYENLRKLTRDDFDSYFAEIIISKNDSTKLRYRRVTYDYGNYEGDPFLNINIIKEKVDDTENLKGQALVLIMTRRCLDYNVRPLIVE